MLVSVFGNGRQSFSVLSISLSASFMINDLYKDSEASVVVFCFSSNFYVGNNASQHYIDLISH